METLLTWLVLGVLGAILAVALSALYAVPVLLFWNWVMPLIFSLKTLSFLEAWGLTLLCSLLFKSYSGSSSSKKS